MITANELRIRNWVLRAGHPVQVTGISNEGVVLKHGDTFQFEHIQPILLTPEILEKAGFELAGDEYSYNGDSIVDLTFELDNGELTANPFYTGQTVITKIKSLHQLQNLYFALTGEELKIQL